MFAAPNKVVEKFEISIADWSLVAQPFPAHPPSTYLLLLLSSWAA